MSTGSEGRKGGGSKIKSSTAAKRREKSIKKREEKLKNFVNKNERLKKETLF